MTKQRNNFHSYVGKNIFSEQKAKLILSEVLLEMASPSITTDFGVSDPNGTLKQQQPSQAAQAQRQETLKQQQLQSMSQEDFDNLPDATSENIIVKQGPDGNLYFFTKDPSKVSFISPTPSVSAKQTNNIRQQVAEASYNFLDPSILSDDVLAPLPVEGQPVSSIPPTIKVEVEIKTNNDEEDSDEEETEKDPKKDKKKESEKETDEEDADYDPLAELPPLDLSADIQQAVQKAQQGMMPNIVISPLRDMPIGSVHAVSQAVPKHSLKSIEDDPYGLSAVGMDNDMGLKLL